MKARIWHWQAPFICVAVPRHDWYGTVLKFLGLSQGLPRFHRELLWLGQCKLAGSVAQFSRESVLHYFIRLQKL
jgi:hypothetical protein